MSEKVVTENNSLSEDVKKLLLSLVNNITIKGDDPRLVEAAELIEKAKKELESVK